MEEPERTELEAFASVLMRLVRDEAIRSCDRLTSSGAETGTEADRWRQLFSTSEARSVAHDLIPEVVDQTLFHFLNAVDNGELCLAWLAADGSAQPLSEIGKGEMAGWLMGSPGWRHAYSSARFDDPFKDLRLHLPGK
jgi:hypothetical protein